MNLRLIFFNTHGDADAIRAFYRKKNIHSAGSHATTRGYKHSRTPMCDPAWKPRYLDHKFEILHIHLKNLSFEFLSADQILGSEKKPLELCSSMGGVWS